MTRCAFRAMPGRAFEQCRRSGRWVLRIDGETITRPLCLTHARVNEDHAVAQVMNTRRVTVEEVAR
jgi:hypothetical protein